MDKNEISTYLVKPGELTLKGGNRKFFEKALRYNLSSLLNNNETRIIMKEGRIFVECSREEERNTEISLNRLIGIAGWAKARKAEKKDTSVIAACVEEAKLLWEDGIKNYKVEARRTDKAFPLDSYQIRCMAGDAIKEALPDLKVNVKKPEVIIAVEIREKAYIYGKIHEGRRGLPVGTAGKGLLLLSGGIDSPVAGYMMATRGLALEAVYFHSWPYTQMEAREKAKKLAEILGQYTQGINFFSVSLTEIQTRIKDRSPLPYRTVLLRMAMMECAEKLANIRKCKCLINGESLSQVASQTIENISCTKSRIRLPVLRPLIGLNKEEIISISEKIGTYETSILPYDDCCTLFSPPHPVLRGDPREAGELYEALEISSLMEEALEKREMEKLSLIKP